MYQLIIADDDEIIRNGLTKVVPWNNLGFEVAASVASGREALSYIKEHKADVILTDINMPEITGLDLIREAKKCQPRIKSVVVSGYSEFEYAKSAIDLKVESYLLKPLSPEEISQVFVRIKSALDMESASRGEAENPKIHREYELMLALNQKLSGSTDFKMICQNEKYCELVFIKLFEGVSVDADMESIDSCAQAVVGVLTDYFYCAVDRMFVTLVPPGKLGSLIYNLEEVLSGFHQINHRISIGKEVYAKSEAITSYWSAVELVKETEKSTMLHYSREHSRFKKDWIVLHDLSQKLFHELEAAKQLRVDELVGAIKEILGAYDVNDAFDSFKDILERASVYFHMEQNRPFALLEAYGSHESFTGTFEEAAILFARDIQVLADMVRSSADSMSRFLVNQAMQTIEENYGDKTLSLASLANTLNVSYGYLSTIFAKNIGKSFKSCLVEVRMERARALLVSRKYKVYEIADLVGYSSPGYFTDAFKKYFGSSPADYLTRLRGEY